MKSNEVERRRRKYGQNILPQEPPPSVFRMLLKQITDYMVLILLVAAIVSFAFRVSNSHITFQIDCNKTEFRLLLYFFLYRIG